MGCSCRLFEAFLVGGLVTACAIVGIAGLVYRAFVKGACP